MLKNLFNFSEKMIKYIFGAGFIIAILLMISLKGCYEGTNKYDSKNVEATINGNIELQKMQDTKEKEAMRLNTIKQNAEAAAETQMRISDNQTSVELKKTLDVTSIEEKKLEMQNKTILDVNKAKQMKMEYEMKKLELIEAQKLQNELKLAEMKLELEKTKMQQEKASAEARAQEAAKKKAQANAQAVKNKKTEIDIYKSIIDN